MSDLEDTATYRNRAEELRAMADDSSDKNREALLRAAEVFDALAEIAKQAEIERDTADASAMSSLHREFSGGVCAIIPEKSAKQTSASLKTRGTLRLER